MNSLVLLLSDPSPCLRWLVLRDLLGRNKDDPELQVLDGLRSSDPLVTGLESAIAKGEVSATEQRSSSPDMNKSRFRSIVSELRKLGYLGFCRGYAPIDQLAEELLSTQLSDGSWPMDQNPETEALSKGYTMVPLQTAIPLSALAHCGYGEDPRCERGYEWLLDKRLEDGAWPTGIASGVRGFVAGYRRMPHSRWGCRSNTTGSLLALAHHPKRCSGKEAARGLDLLLGRDTLEKHTLGFEVARIIGAEPTRGFFTFFAKFDVALILGLCVRIGASLDDPRVRRFVDFVRSLRGSGGLWEYPKRPQVTRWISFDILRSLAGIDEDSDWLSREPVTPFQSYPKQPRRY